MVPVRSLLIACLSATLSAQSPARPPLPVGDREPVWEAQEGPLGRYRPNPIRRTISGDSARLDALTRAGNLYLSLKDAIALAVENNLDVEYHRLTPLLAEADLLRARAGGVAPVFLQTFEKDPQVWARPEPAFPVLPDCKVSRTRVALPQPEPPTRCGDGQRSRRAQP